MWNYNLIQGQIKLGISFLMLFLIFLVVIFNNDPSTFKDLGTNPSYRDLGAI